MERINELLARLGELTDEELAELGELIAGEIESLTAEDQEPTEELIAAMDAIAAARETYDGEVTRRQELKAEQKTKADELRKKLRGEEDSGDPETDDEDGETPPPDGEDAEGKKEPVAAAASKKTVPAVPRRSPGARTVPAAAAPAAAPKASVLTAAANLQYASVGEDLGTADKLGAAVREVWMSARGYRGGRQEVPVATLSRDWPEERILDDSVGSNEEKIAAVTSREAITAAGGICAPIPIDYSLPVIGSNRRPIRDALPNFGATRGGVRTLVPPTLADVSGAVTTWTEANDTTPSSPTTKACLTIPCGTDATSTVDAIVQCITFGNFRDRFFPEQVPAFSTLIDTWVARVAEQKLITKIDAGSTAITAGQLLGSTRDFLAALDRYNASVRYYYRLDDTDRLRMLAPRWLRDDMRADLAREMPGSSAERLAMADAELERLISVRGFNVSWIWEGVSGQRFVLPVAGGLQPWPGTVSVYIFPEGSWMYLDGGTLNLGVVRDSTLNATNNLQMFEEIFENVHYHGTFSHRLNVDICPSGLSAGAATSTYTVPCTSGS